MKPRIQTATADGFDTNVAQKMPKIRKLEEPHTLILEQDIPRQEKEGDQTPIDDQTFFPEMSLPEKQAERKAIFESSQKGIASESSLDVLKLIEDLHGQLLASAQTKKGPGDGSGFLQEEYPTIKPGQSGIAAPVGGPEQRRSETQRNPVRIDLSPRRDMRMP